MSTSFSITPPGVLQSNVGNCTDTPDYLNCSVKSRVFRRFLFRSNRKALFFFSFFFLFFILITFLLRHIVVYTYSKIKSHKKSYKIFDFKSRHSPFYKAIEKRRDVSSKQLICMTKQRKYILPPKTERYEAKITKKSSNRKATVKMGSKTSNLFICTIAALKPS